MNIFVLHLNPYICAQMHCDKHVIKMIIESAQMLYTCCLICGIIGHDIDELIMTAPVTAKGSHGYRVTHRNHPCCKWLRESIANYHWLIKMSKELCRQYTRRYGKIHATEQHIDWLSYVCPNIPDKSITPFAIAMPEYCKQAAVITQPHDLSPMDHIQSTHKLDVIKSYRNYYIIEKQFAKWTNSNIPQWYQMGRAPKDKVSTPSLDD